MAFSATLHTQGLQVVVAQQWMKDQHLGNLLQHALWSVPDHYSNIIRIIINYININSIIITACVLPGRQYQRPPSPALVSNNNSNHPAHQTINLGWPIIPSLLNGRGIVYHQTSEWHHHSSPSDENWKHFSITQVLSATSYQCTVSCYTRYMGQNITLKSCCGGNNLLTSLTITDWENERSCKGV